MESLVFLFAENAFIGGLVGGYIGNNRGRKIEGRFYELSKAAFSAEHSLV